MVLSMRGGSEIRKNRGREKGEEENENPDDGEGAALLNEAYYVQQVDENSTWCQLILLIMFKVKHDGT